MAVLPEHVRKVYSEAELLRDQAQVDLALDRMAEAITDRLEEHNPLVLCVLTGAIVAAGHLLTRLDFPLELDYCHATRYRGDTAGGELHWIAKPRHSLEGRSVLVVDDILDEGYTLEAILEACRAAGAHEVLSAVLVDKMHARGNGLTADFVGLEIEDRYVFGYGMDYKGYLRNAPGIFAVRGM